MSNEIVKSQPSIIATVQDMQTMAQVFVKSGFFTDAADVSKAMVKIAAGREIGLEPFASMSGIHVIKGKVTYGANILAAKVKASGRYDYRVKEMSEKACRLMFYQRIDGKWEEIGPSDFTMEDARKAGTQNTDRFPRNMLFARAISNGVKWYCPDVTQGVTVYTPEDFGAVVNDDGVVESVDGKVIESEPAKPAQDDAAKAKGMALYSEMDARAAKVGIDAPIDEAEARYKDALEVTTPKGSRLADLNHVQLQACTLSKNEQIASAAKIVLDYRAALNGKGKDAIDELFPQ